MHELSVAQALMGAVRKATPPQTRLVEVRIAVGELEHLDAEILQQAWQALAESTPYAGSTLSIRRVPARMRCRACHRQYTPDDVCVLFCPTCGAARPEVMAGTGILLTSLEVEEEEVEEEECRFNAKIMGCERNGASRRWRSEPAASALPLTSRNPKSKA